VSRKQRVLRAVAATTGVLIALSACWSAAYFMTSRAYEHIGTRPDGLVQQLINSLLGIFLLGAVFFVISLLTNLQQKQNTLLQSMNEAMRRIAKGDFSVNLTPNQVGGHPFSELADSINYMAVELSQMEKMRQEFISNVSHEIQSPLTSIGGFARALQGDDLDREERLHYLNIIEAESTRLSRLSENLLKLTALESEHPPFEPKRYRLDRQLRNIVLSCEPQWVEKELEMDIALEEVSIAADEDLMSQVWVNLLNNSIKFTPDGGTIGIGVQRRDHEAVVCISDTGIGIAPDDLARIFERFYKADKSRSRYTGGSGLGLAIAKKITEMHQGTIHVESALGAGTRLTVHLPGGQ
jgi:two-component system phosphate regulon sensor histidine kinase PhoR